MNKLNYVNALLMLASAGLALFIPFELVLLSYAILGPAHYLTEISWLNRRRFFTMKSYDVFFIAAVAIVCLLLRLPAANLILYTFGLSFILLAFSNNVMRIAAFLLLIAAGYFLLTNNLLRTILGLYVPTLIHVYVFTGAFLLLGALKLKNVSGYVAFFTFLLCPVLLCILFTGLHTVPTQWATANYAHFKSLNTTSLRTQHMDIYANRGSIILTRLIAFAYTYHYINWFSKTSIINWHHVKTKWVIVMALIWAASVILYFFNYRLGIKWLFLLSLAHVILEFPLNYRSFAGIGRLLKTNFTRTG